MKTTRSRTHLDLQAKGGKISKSQKLSEITLERAKNNPKSYSPKPTRKMKISCQSTNKCSKIPNVHKFCPNRKRWQNIKGLTCPQNKHKSIRPRPVRLLFFFFISSKALRFYHPFALSSSPFWFLESFDPKGLFKGLKVTNYLIARMSWSQ